MPNIEYAPPEWEEDEEEVTEDEDREEGDSNNSPDGFPVNSSPSATDDGLDNPNGNKEVSDSEVENSIPREKPVPKMQWKRIRVTPDNDSEEESVKTSNIIESLKDEN